MTLLEHTRLSRPVTVRERVVLETGAPVVWFTFPGAWHDVGRFHTIDGDFTGYYANVLTPVRIVTPWEWETTDLFLDVWLDDTGAVLLDEDELREALRNGDIDEAAAGRARAEAAALMERAGIGDWPPPICREWTLERALARVAGAGGTRGGAAV